MPLAATTKINKRGIETIRAPDDSQGELVVEVATRFANTITGSNTLPRGTLIGQTAVWNGDSWVLEDSRRNLWLSQSVWYVDSTTGNDNNDGATSTTPLATFAALNSRWNGGTISSHTIVYVQSDMSEDPYPHVRVGKNQSLRYIAAELETLLTGTIATYTEAAGVSGSLSEPRITVFGVTDWDTAGPGGSSLLGYQMLITSGVGSTGGGTALMLVSKLDTDASVIQCTLGSSMVENAAVPSFPVTLAPTAGSGFKIVRRASIPTFNPSRLAYEYGGTPARPAFMLIGFRCTESHYQQWNIAAPVGAYTFRCRFVGSHLISVSHQVGISFQSCVVEGTTFGVGIRLGAVNMSASAIRVTSGNALSVSSLCNAFISNRAFTVGGRVLSGPGSIIGGNSLGIYMNPVMSGEPTQAALRVAPGANVGPIGSGGTTWLTYGKTTNGCTVWVEPGGTAMFRRGSPPMVTGSVAGEDYQLGAGATGVKKAWTVLPADGEESGFARLIAGQ